MKPPIMMLAPSGIISMARTMDMVFSIQPTQTARTGLTSAAASKRHLHLQPHASALRSVHRVEFALGLRDQADLLRQRSGDIRADRIHPAAIAIAVDRCIVLHIIRCLAIQEAIDSKRDCLRDVVAAAKL